MGFSNDDGYRGKANLKPRGTKISWTGEMIQEYIKCSKDPIYFIETYMKIRDADGEEVNFKLYPYQKDMILAMWNNRRSIFATARQAGKSTTTCGFILWFTIFNEGQTVAILANKGETAQEILGRVKYAYETLPLWLQAGMDKWNEKSIVFENGSRIFAGTTTKDSIRGYTINLLFIDEAAHVENWNEFYTAVFNTISSGKRSKIVLVSTPLGLNHFHDYWDGATKKVNGYAPVMVTWKDVPGRDEAWKEEQLRASNYDYEKFAQEQEVEFLGSSGTLISGPTLRHIKDHILQPVAGQEGVSMYKKPVPKHKYAVVADVGHGVGSDYHAFSVFDVTAMPFEQVAVFHDNKITPDEYAETIYRMSLHYNEALALVEVNDMGFHVAEALYNDYEYTNIVQTESKAQNKRVSQGFNAKRPDKGLRTTTQTKAQGCGILKLLIEHGKLIVRDKQTYNELTTFSRKLKSYEAEAGKHDDLVMTLVLFAWLSQQDYFKDETDINTLKELRVKSQEQLEEDMAPLLIHDPHEGEQFVIDSDYGDTTTPGEEDFFSIM